MSRWVSAAPTECDVCNKPIGRKFYDVSVPLYGGSWACVCESCFGELGCSLGVGRGQEYTRREATGEYICTAGGRKHERQGDTSHLHDEGG